MKKKSFGRDLEMIRSAKLQSRVNEICLESVMNMTQDKETKFYARRSKF